MNRYEHILHQKMHIDFPEQLGMPGEFFSTILTNWLMTATAAILWDPGMVLNYSPYDAVVFSLFCNIDVNYSVLRVLLRIQSESLVVWFVLTCSTVTIQSSVHNSCNNNNITTIMEWFSVEQPY